MNRDFTRSLRKTSRQLLVKNEVNISTRTLQRFPKRERYSINIVKKKSIFNKKKAEYSFKYARNMLQNRSNNKLDEIMFLNKLANQRGQEYKEEYVRKRQNKRQGYEPVSSANRCI